MHTDEAVHGVILGDMLQGGVYRYNPQDSHGPTLYYLTWPFLRVMGVHNLAQMEAWQLRLVPALIGTAFILSLGLWAREFGTVAIWSAGVVAALSAPFVYYQRYFIHEALFVFLSLLLVFALWRFLTVGSLFSALGIGVLTGLLFATKETAPLVLVALAVAGALTWITQTPRRVFTMSARQTGGLLLAGAIFALTFILFYSSFGANDQGLVDAFHAIFRFAHRAGGEGHEKPWWTYLGWMLAPGFYTIPWSGWIIGVLGLGGVYACWQNPLVRLLVFYTLATLAIYSAIPYKTPWLELNILAPACLLAGVGGDAFYARTKGRLRAVFYLAAVLVIFALVRETACLCLDHPVDPRSPLAYSPTVEDIQSLVQDVDALSLRHDAYIEVVSDDYWPLPWYLRHETRVGYWNHIPERLDGDVIIASPAQLAGLQARLGPDWTVQYFGLRPEVLAVVLSKKINP